MLVICNSLQGKCSPNSLTVYQDLVIKEDSTEKKLNPSLTARELKSPPLEVGTWAQLSAKTHLRKSSYVRKLANEYLSWSDWWTLQPHNHRLLAYSALTRSMKHWFLVGVFPIYRHTDIRDLTASLMEAVSAFTEIEPALKPLTSEVLHGRSANIQDHSRIDIRSKGFWNQHQGAFFDVIV